MKKLFAIVVLISSVVTSTVFAQTKKAPTKPAPKVAAPAKPAVKPNPWVFTYGADTVYRDEFERLLSKNRKEKEAPSKDEILEYLELYQNFKMKVKEARLMQLDTFTSFKTELAGYRKQLANPYLTDKKVTESLITEAYNRLKEEINASHILINCAENASPKDTLAAYNKLLDLRKRIIKGESFDSVAAKNSEDPSAKSNNGNLGWFTVFYMIYPFENFAYNTPKGQVSMPFRTKFGYHIIKVNDRRPARGEVKVAHIMLKGGSGDSKESMDENKVKIDSIYNALQKGASFEDIVKEVSVDMSSNQNKGVINFFGSFSSYPDKFKDVSFSTPRGEISKPFQTEYGWHIIKVLEKKETPELKEVEESIKSKITRDSRSESSRAVVSQRIKRETKYTEHTANLKEFIGYLDSTFMSGTWEPNYSLIKEKPIVSFNDKIFTTHDFARFVRSAQEPRKNDESAEMAANNLYKKFTDEKALEYEEGILESKYDDFRNLMQEYHDGIMLFDLTEKKVWNRAHTDTAGLEKFHAANSSKYMWKDRLAVVTVTCLNDKVKQEAIKMARAGKSNDEISAKLNKKVKGSVTFELNKFEKGANANMDKLWDKKGVEDIANQNNTFRFYIVQGVVGPEPKTVKEARGPLTSDYQNYLEKEWIKELRAKYPVTVNTPVLDQLFK
jgi:peptidyl-prolyl cis-trans isomerase SurA